MAETTVVQEDRLPLLGTISAVIRWLIESISTVAEPLLIAATVVMIASDVNGGDLIRNNGLLQWIYSWGQGLGIEGQMVALAIRSRKAFTDGNAGGGVFLSVLVILLAAVTFLGVGLANDQVTFHRSVQDSLAQLGISQEAWVWIRAGILVTVAVTGAYLIYVPKKQLSAAEVEAQQEQMRLQAQLEKTRTEINSEKNKDRLKGWRETINTARGKPNTPPVEAEIPETAVAFASQETGELPNGDGLITAEPPPISGLAEKGNWWDAQSYIDYVAFQYGIAVPPKKAQEVIDLVGKKKRIQRIGAAGKPSAFARISALKAYAKREYPPVNIPATSGVFAEQMAE